MTWLVLAIFAQVNIAVGPISEAQCRMLLPQMVAKWQADMPLEAWGKLAHAPDVAGFCIKHPVEPGTRMAWV
jgi:hypothetical protein